MKDLFGHEPKPSPRKAFDGQTYEPKRDYIRLKGQLNAVMCLMKDGRWRTLSKKYAMKLMAEAKHQSVLVCVTYEKKNMAHTLSSANISEVGLFRYRLILNQETNYDR